jgi:genome maintenance exonuclease 1
MIKSPYEYQTLERVTNQNQRFYLSPAREKLPSVTTILSATKPLADREALQRWRRSVGEKRATEITTEAASRGTRMHKFLETFLETGIMPAPGTNPYSIQSQKMAQVIAQQGLVHLTAAWGTEVSVYFPGLYAGTTDLVGTWQNKPAILDFKQTNRVKKREWISDYFIQLCLYAEAHNAVHGTDICEGHILMCTADFEYQQFDIWPDEYEYWKNLAWDRVQQFHLGTVHKYH